MLGNILQEVGMGVFAGLALERFGERFSVYILTFQTSSKWNF
jgi:hypothetical protein